MNCTEHRNPLRRVFHLRAPTIRELAEANDATGFAGAIEWDRSKPDGTPRKLMDSSRIRALGWKPQTPLRKGLRTIAAPHS
jgi:GDP-L-fucose synthase